MNFLGGNEQTKCPVCDNVNQSNNICGRCSFPVNKNQLSFSDFVTWGKTLLSRFKEAESELVSSLKQAEFERDQLKLQIAQITKPNNQNISQQIDIDQLEQRLEQKLKAFLVNELNNIKTSNIIQPQTPFNQPISNPAKPVTSPPISNVSYQTPYNANPPISNTSQTVTSPPVSNVPSLSQNINLTEEEKYLLKIYNDPTKNDDLTKVVVKTVSETQNSMDERRFDPRKPVILQEERNENYWIVNINNQLNLVLNKKRFRINQFNLTTLESLFQCLGSEPRNYEKFTLVKPGKISFLPDTQEWQLTEPGIIHFGD